MTLHIQHRSDYPDAYALTNDTVRLTLQIESTQPIQRVEVVYGDKYEEGFPECTELLAVGCDGHVVYYTADIPVPTRRLKYVFRVASGTGAPQWFGESGMGDKIDAILPFFKPYLCSRDTFTIPSWAREAVAYEIFPDRFYNGNPALTPTGSVPWSSEPTPASFYGGDLPGIQAKLDYLSDLGVNLLYLTPIFTSGSNHKYNTYDYFQIDPNFGTEADLRSLVKSAHDRGIRVVLDAVFNRSGTKFAPFVDTLEKGKQSPYWDWFFIDGASVDMSQVNYETFATKLSSMPKLNLANSAAESYFLKVATYWIEACDIDGWRLDVANEIDSVFWRKFRQSVKSLKPEALIIGEVWHDALPWLRGDQFDGVMNYPFRENVLDLFAKRNISTRTFAARMTKLLHQYPEQAVAASFNLLGSHDTERALTVAEDNIDRMVQMLIFLLTAPGIPMLYYGDEIGMAGGPDPLCRAGMRWAEAEQNQRLLKVVRTLTALRRQEPALQGPDLEFAPSPENALRYRRRSRDGQSEVLIEFVGFSALSQSTEPDLEAFWTTALQDATVLYETELTIHSDASVPVEKGRITLWKRKITK